MTIWQRNNDVHGLKKGLLWHCLLPVTEDTKSWWEDLLMLVSSIGFTYSDNNLDYMYVDKLTKERRINRVDGRIYILIIMQCIMNTGTNSISVLPTWISPIFAEDLLCCPTLCKIFKRNQIHLFFETGSLPGRRRRRHLHVVYTFCI